MKFGIGAIFKDEYEYVLEWIAWHELAGFSRFFIADNGSTDGTKQLLDVLSKIGIIDTFVVPPQPNAQLLAYQFIKKRWGAEVDAIAFIDADEFIFSDDGKKPTEYLENWFKPNVGAIGINWRVFGSSGKVAQEPELVTTRFLKCANDNMAVNRHIKSIVRPSLIKNIHCHYSDIPYDWLYVNGAGNQMIFTDSNGQHCKNHNSFCDVAGHLRVNHYVIKSFEEFIKKRKRGDAMIGPNHDRGYAFFVRHDFDDVEFISASLLADFVIKEIKSIEHEIKTFKYKFLCLI